MILVAAYLAIFAAGPLVFFALARPKPSLDRFMLHSATSVGFMVAGSLLWQQTGQAAMALALLCLWLGWVVMAVAAVQAVCFLHGKRGKIWRWSATLGATATVVPWFGLSLTLT